MPYAEDRHPTTTPHRNPHPPAPYDGTLSQITGNPHLKRLDLAANQLVSFGKHVDSLHKLLDALPTTALTHLSLEKNNLTNFGNDVRARPPS